MFSDEFKILSSFPSSSDQENLQQSLSNMKTFSVDNDVEMYIT